MADEQKSFTVRDRRSFTGAGERRPEPQDEPSRPDTGAPPPARTQTSAPTEAEDVVTLASFVVGLATQASLLLGGLTDEDGSTLPPDLRAVRHVIGILEMLEVKTQGQRTPEENQILERVLYELRMAYVRVDSAGVA